MENRYEREDLQAALRVLREGGVILYPTDTIWGIGCDATNAEAIAENSAKILANAEAIAENSEDIAANEQLIAENKTLIDDNAALIEENKGAITNLEKDVAKNAEAIAENATLIAQNTTAINNNAQAISDNAAAIAQLRTDLATTKEEITEAYTEAITTAISTLDGELHDQIATEVATINSRIDNEVEAINSAIASLTERVATLEKEVEEIQTSLTEIREDIDKIREDISNLMERIQSISYIPKYSDGKATLRYIQDKGYLNLDFEVSPKDVLPNLVDNWESMLSVKAVQTETRAVDFISMPIISFNVDIDNGIISVVVSGDNLLAQCSNDNMSASVAMVISDGNNSVISEYVPVYFEEATDELWYTSTDGNIVTPYATDAFGANIISNTYENGRGVIKFDSTITQIGEDAFYCSYQLTEITIPNTVTQIGKHAFYECDRLKKFNSAFASEDGRCLIVNNELVEFAPAELLEYNLPDGIIHIGESVFSGCDITSITIPEGVISIGQAAFSWCGYLTNITIPNTVKQIERDAFLGCHRLQKFNSPLASEDGRCLIIDNRLVVFAPAQLSDYNIPDGVIHIGEWAFSSCDITNITVPESVVSIGEFAFYGCYSLISINIPSNVTYIGENAYAACENLEFVYCQPVVPPTGNYGMFEMNAKHRKIYVPNSSVDLYESAEYWSDYAGAIDGYDF